MADISKVTASDGTTYDIKDTTARSAIDDKIDKVNGTGTGKLIISSDNSNSIAEVRAKPAYASDKAMIVAGYGTYGNPAIYLSMNNANGKMTLSISDTTDDFDLITVDSSHNISGRAFGNYTLPKSGSPLGQGASYPNNLRYNTIGGSLTGSGMELYLFLPFPFPPSLPNLTYCRLSVRHAQNTDYAYMLEGSSRYALNASNTQSTLMNNGTLRSGVDSITCGELGIHGFNLKIKFKNALAINTSGTALNNNSPVACFIDLQGTWS